MIEARGLVKRYGSTMAVNDLSFSIRPGLVTGFLGPNGAGKTTTMRMILGLDARRRARSPSTAAATAICRRPRARWAPCWTPRRCTAAAGPATTCCAWP